MSDSVWPQPTRLPHPWDSPGKNTGVGCHFLLQCRKVKSESEVAQSCPTLRNPMDYSLPGSSVHGILQARILGWVAISFSRGSSWPRNWTQVFCIAGSFFTNWVNISDSKTYHPREEKRNMDVITKCPRRISSLRKHYLSRSVFRTLVFPKLIHSITGQ